MKKSRKGCRLSQSEQEFMYIKESYYLTVDCRMATEGRSFLKETLHIKISRTVARIITNCQFSVTS